MDPDYEVIESRLGFADATQASLQRNAIYATLVFRFLQGWSRRGCLRNPSKGPWASRATPATLCGRLAGLDCLHGSHQREPRHLQPVADSDSGRGMITMLLLESFIRRDISIAIKERIVQAGFLFLMLVFVFVMYNDISK